MSRTLRIMLFSTIAVFTTPAATLAADSGSGQVAEADATASRPAPEPAPAPAASQPVATAPVAEAVTLLCTGTYYDPNIADPVARQRATQFTIKLSYAGNYMELKASEWPALQPSKENPAIVRTAKFLYDDSVVKAHFLSEGDDVRGALFSIGLAGVAGDKDTITLDRKTGNFNYPNTSGHCEKVETQETPNKF
ncbi:hypothetical protein [Emcibacter sp. SYSU 3D8]|uniref:hypothetical protein n=1 Tax=Emcibacter sp. SYSU 3D8 TaxID=3133969 RepID=UPI0031FED641